MRSNILYLTAYFPPEKAASDYLWENLIAKFADEDMTIIVHTPNPCRGVSREIRKQYCNRNEILLNGHLWINRFSLYAEGRNPIMRAMRYTFCWGIHLIKGLRAKNIDCVFLDSTPPIQGMLGAFLKNLKRIPFVYNLQDIFPDSLVNNGLTKEGGILWKIGRMIENFSYRHADKIIVISEDFKKNIIAKGVPEDKIVVVYNWVDQNIVVDIPRENNKLFDKYNLDRSKFYVTYNGNIGLSQNMEMLLDVANDLKTNSDIQFVLVGEGANLEKVKHIVQEHQLDNVHLIPFQPYEDIGHVFSLGDVSLVISKPGTGSASVPSKTWSIMSASRPVLANFDENELKDIINKNQCGIFTKAGDKDAFKNAILKLYQNPELCRDYGQNGRQFIMNNLTREVGTQKYVNVIKSVIDNNS